MLNTFEQFIEQLTKLSGQRWELQERKIRRYVDLYCPLTAVAHVLTGEFYSQADPRMAGSRIGLSMPVINKILLAQENAIRDPEIETARAVMLTALGIRE